MGQDRISFEEESRLFHAYVAQFKCYPPRNAEQGPEPGYWDVVKRAIETGDPLTEEITKLMGDDFDPNNPAHWPQKK